MLSCSVVRYNKCLLFLAQEYVFIDRQAHSCGRNTCSVWQRKVHHSHRSAAARTITTLCKVRFFDKVRLRVPRQHSIRHPKPGAVCGIEHFAAFKAMTCCGLSWKLREAVLDLPAVATTRCHCVDGWLSNARSTDESGVSRRNARMRRAEAVH